MTLCAIAGAKIITGGNRLASGVVDVLRTEDIVRNLVQKGFGHVPEPGAPEPAEDTDIGRDAYVAMFGPTVGDEVRLGDTALWIEVERDEVSFEQWLENCQDHQLYHPDGVWGRGQVWRRYALWHSGDVESARTDVRDQAKPFARVWDKPPADQHPRRLI